MEPWGPRQEELRAGVVASAAGNAWGAKLTPEKLFPSLKARRRAADGRAAFAALAPALTPIEA